MFIFEGYFGRILYTGDFRFVTLWKGEGRRGGERGGVEKEKGWRERRDGEKRRGEGVRKRRKRKVFGLLEL